MSRIPPGAAPHFDAVFQANLRELFRWRRDVRHFRPDPVPRDVLDELLEIACLAPSVGLSQPWRFVVVEDPKRRAAIRADFARCNEAALARQPASRAARYARLKLAGLELAPCHLALFAEPDPQQGSGLGRGTMPQTAAYSAVLAAHTLWLAARAIGLGLGWISILEPSSVSRILDIPEAWVFIGYFCLGVPEAEESIPELEREGWEQRRSAAALSLVR